jgi:hypothetical protein
VSVGKEHLQKLHEALERFEAAVKEREHPGLLRNKVALQQDVDTARQRVVEVVVQIAVAERARA